MRNHVINELIELAGQDDRINLLVGDLGFNVVEEFANKYPDRFINCGIAEDNMMAVAAGMALEGDVVFVYSIGNFPTLRCLEQIRNAVCYHKANVNIISVGGGFSYGSLGMTHHTTEELAILRALPEMRVYAPADSYEALAVLHKISKDQYPSYMRLARGSDKVIHSGEIENIDKLIPFRDYNEEHYQVSIISAGTILDDAVAAEEILNEKNITTRVFSCPSIKPLDKDGIINLAGTSDYICTVEEHNIYGGLGGAVAEVLSELKEHAPLIRFGLNDEYSSTVGSREYLRKFYGMDCEAIVDRITKRI